MRPNLSPNARLSIRTGQFRCNLCQELCASDRALREHYQVCHPEAAAKIEHTLAELSGKNTQSR
jgi:hypothetical protein